MADRSMQAAQEMRGAMRADRGDFYGGGGSRLEAAPPGAGGNAWDRMGAMGGLQKGFADRRSMAMGPPPPRGVASLGVGPVDTGESSIQAAEGTPEDRTRMEEAMAAATDRGARFEQPPPTPATGIDAGRAAMGYGRGLPPRGPMRGRSFGRGRGSAIY